MGLSGIHTKQWHLHDQADPARQGKKAIIVPKMLIACLELPDTTVIQAT